MSAKLDRHSGWILCRNLQTIPVPDVDVLESWAEHGRIRPDDYLVNPSLETCFQAKEIKELEKIFRNARMRHLHFISRLLSPWQWEW